MKRWTVTDHNGKVASRHLFKSGAVEACMILNGHAHGTAVTYYVSR